MRLFFSLTLGSFPPAYCRATRTGETRPKFTFNAEFFFGFPSQPGTFFPTSCFFFPAIHATRFCLCFVFSSVLCYEIQRSTPPLSFFLSRPPISLMEPVLQLLFIFPLRFFPPVPSLPPFTSLFSPLGLRFFSVFPFSNGCPPRLFSTFLLQPPFFSEPSQRAVTHVGLVFPLFFPCLSFSPPPPTVGVLPFMFVCELFSFRCPSA